MDTLKNENKDFTSDVVYHLEQLECDLLSFQIDNNRNFILSKSIDNLLIRVNMIKSLVQIEPRFDLMVIYEGLIKKIKQDNQLTGCYLLLDWKVITEPNRGLLKYSINKPKSDNNGLR